MKKKLLITITAVATVLLTGCVESYEYEYVEGEIIEKVYDPPEWKMKTITDTSGDKVTVPQYEEEEYEVTISYENIVREFEFEDDAYFNSVQVGEKKTILLIKGLDKAGNVVTLDIDIP